MREVAGARKFYVIIREGAMSSSVGIYESMTKAKQEAKRLSRKHKDNSAFIILKSVRSIQIILEPQEKDLELGDKV